MLLTKQGDTLKSKPDPGELVDLGTDSFDVSRSYEVMIYSKVPGGGDPPNGKRPAILLAIEHYSDKPTDAQVAWCLLHHKGDFAHIHETCTVMQLPF